MVTSAKAAVPTVMDQAAAMQLGQCSKNLATCLAELRTATQKVHSFKTTTLTVCAVCVLRQNNIFRRMRRGYPLTGVLAREVFFFPPIPVEVMDIHVCLITPGPRSVRAPGDRLGPENGPEPPERAAGRQDVRHRGPTETSPRGVGQYTPGGTLPITRNSPALIGQTRSTYELDVEYEPRRCAPYVLNNSTLFHYV